MGINSIIVKIGGKILENEADLNATISQFQTILNEGYADKIVIIAGGGSYANFIRLLDDRLDLGDDLSHWMAIYAMDLNGIMIHEKYPFIKLFDKYQNLKEMFYNNSNEKEIAIFLPFNYLKMHDPLPHSWNVTSDSICLYFAKKIKCNECFLIKDVDGLMIVDGNNQSLIKNVSIEEYNKLLFSKKFVIMKENYNPTKNSVPVDSNLLSLIDKYRIPCIILNGTSSKLRILNYFKEIDEENKIYSKIF